MSAVYTTTPTKQATLYPSPSGMPPSYPIEPYVSPSSAHQRSLTSCGGTSLSPTLGGGGGDPPRRRLRSAAPSISSNSHHRRVAGALNPPAPTPAFAAPSGSTSSFDLTPVASPSKQASSSYRRSQADDEDSVMRDPSPLRPTVVPAQPRKLVRGDSRDVYRDGPARPALSVSSSNDQLRTADEGDSSTDDGSRRGSIEEGSSTSTTGAVGQHSRSFLARQREFSQHQQQAAFSLPAQDSPLKRSAAQFSFSKSLGRAGGSGPRTRSNSSCKRPAASMLMGGEDGDDLSSDEEESGHPMPDFGGRMRLTSSRGADEGAHAGDVMATAAAGDVNGTPGRTPGLRPLSFNNHPSFSPAPSPAAHESNKRAHVHQRALTEQDLNRPLSGRSFLSSYGSASKLIADEDNIFLDSPDAASRSRASTSTGGGGLFSGSVALNRSRSLASNDDAQAKSLLSASGSALRGSAASMSNSKKAVSMDNLQVPPSFGGHHGLDNGGGPPPPPSAFNPGAAGTAQPTRGAVTRSRRSAGLSQAIRPGGAHKRTSSQDCNAQPVARPQTAVKSNSAQNLSSQAGALVLPSSASLTQLSSASHLAASKIRNESILNRSAPASFNRPPTASELDGLAFNEARPLMSAFTAKQSLGKKFKPRDSAISLDGGDGGAAVFADSPMTGSRTHEMLPPPLPPLAMSQHQQQQRGPVPAFPSRLSTSQLAHPPAAAGREDDEMDLQELMTPACEVSGPSGWPSLSGPAAAAGGPSLASSASSTAFDFLGREAAEAMASAAALHHSTGSASGKHMPDTPVKTKAMFGGAGKSHPMTGGGGGGGAGQQHPHPLSLSMHVEGSSSASSSPSALALPVLGGGGDGGQMHHHSLNVLARSHRPSDGKPPHLKPSAASAALAASAGASNSPARSLIPKRSMTFRPKPSTLQARFAQTSPESAGTGSSSPPSGAESPTFLRRVDGGGGGGRAHAAVGNPSAGAVGLGPADAQRVGSLLRRTSSGVASMSGSESESGVEMTPTRRGPDSFAARSSLIMADDSSPTHPRTTHQELSVADLAGPPASSSRRPLASPLAADPAGSLQPRHSMPNLPPKHASASSRRLHHRSSHPLPQAAPAEDDVFERRFKVVDALGQGAFSQVWKVQERESERVWAVKRTKGVFEGVKDRLRHLEEVDILRALSTPAPHPHVVAFVDAWEQNRQLFIQTELCALGNLAFFLEEYGRLVPRLDEGRVWKIARELSDGIHHIHSHNILHLDLKPANVLITSAGTLKIGDFGLSTRHPRASPADVLRNAGLGGEVPVGLADKGWEREGDRDYMAVETLSGRFGKPADIFSFGLVLLEAATNIIVPTNDAPWHALRSDDFSEIDLAPLSPALVDLVTLCMRAAPDERPGVEDVVGHPVVRRARDGQPALVPEPEAFLVGCLTGRVERPAETAGAWPAGGGAGQVVLEDVEMDG